MRGVGDVGGVGGVARDKGGRAPPEGRDAAQARRYARARARRTGDTASLSRATHRGDGVRGTHRGGRTGDMAASGRDE